jgi:hypothetical protein
MSRLTCLFLITLSASLLVVPSAPAQQLAKRLILKDGSYQLATKWEVKGDRVRYYSAERDDWEEVPKSIVDWDATEKYEKDRAAGKPAPEAVELDKELEAERQADEAKSPHVAPGLRLPDEGGVVLLDTFQTQPQLVELEQSSGSVNKNTGGNILRAAVNPIASSKQNIEIPGLHAKIQSHTSRPSIYLNVASQELGDTEMPKGTGPELPWDRFRIVRAQEKQRKRVVGDIKVAVYGKVSQEQKFVPANSEQLSGGWVKLTPTEDLGSGEYAVVEMLGKEGMNFFVWDFGVNPSAPPNATAWKPDASAVNPSPDKPKELEKRQQGDKQ